MIFKLAQKLFESSLGQWNCFLMSRYSIIREKTSQNHREVSIVLEKSPSASYVLTKWRFVMYKEIQEKMKPVISCSLRFLKPHRTRKKGQNSSFSNNCVFNSITGNTRKIGQNRFFQPEAGFFRKNFLWPHMFWKNVLLTCTMNFSKSCGPFSFAIGWLSYLTKWENVG